MFKRSLNPVVILLFNRVAVPVATLEGNPDPDPTLEGKPDPEHLQKKPRSHLNFKKSGPNPKERANLDLTLIIISYNIKMIFIIIDIITALYSEKSVI